MLLLVANHIREPRRRSRTSVIAASIRSEEYMAQTVAETLVGVLEHIGVKQIFALIGDSLNPLADAVRRSSIEWIGVRHEEGAALAASGQAKLTGRLAVCAGTTGPGSTHLVAGLYEAARDHARPSELHEPFFSKPMDLLSKVEGIEFVTPTRPDECCGFGGTFSVFEEVVSTKMGYDKVTDHAQAGAEYIVSADSSCLMHQRGCAERIGLPIKFIHIAQILNGANA
jgi:hypothetical protein